MARYIVLAVVGCLLVAGGVAALNVPAGVIVAGLEAVLGAYCGLYLKAREVAR